MKFWVVYQFNDRMGDYQLRGVHATSAEAEERYLRVAIKDYARFSPTRGQLGFIEMGIFKITKITLQMWWAKLRGKL